MHQTKHIVNGIEKILKANQENKKFEFIERRTLAFFV